MSIGKRALALGVAAAFSAPAFVGSADAGGGLHHGGGTCGAGGICLDVGVAMADPADPQLCGTATTLDITVGDQVNYCYTVSNESGVQLDFHSLTDNVDEPIFIFDEQPLASGDSIQFNRTLTVGASQTVLSTWTAQTALPGYDLATGDLGPGEPGNCGDWLFANGFDGIVNCDPGTPADFIDISTTGTALGLDDDESIAANLPFSFNLYGESSNRICIGNNGYILFGTTNCPSQGLSKNRALPSTSFATKAILPLWDDLYTGGEIYTATVGASPNRSFIVEWYEKNHYNSGADDPDGVTFEAVFGEDGTLAFNYLKTTFESDTSWDDAGSATVGLQMNQNLADQFSSDTPSLGAYRFLEWTATKDPTIFTDTDAGVTINAGAPDINTIPGALDGTVGAGGSTTTPLDIENLGNRDLLWTSGEAPAAAHFPPAWQLRPSIPTPNAAERASTMTSARPFDGAHDKPRTRPAIVALGAADVPAYLIDHDAVGDQFGTIDAAAPSTFAAIASAPAALYKTGTFVANDFSKEYVAAIDTGEIGTIDTATGTLTALPGSSPPLVFGESWVGLKWDASSSTLRAAACQGTGGGCHLYAVDPVTGSVGQGPAIIGIDSGAGVFLIDIAIAPTGLMYAVDYVSGDLVAIDKTTGAAARSAIPAYSRCTCSRSISTSPPASSTGRRST